MTLPQVYKPTTQCRCSFRGKKFLGSRIYAFIKGGGKEDFGTWEKMNRGASLKVIKERMDKYHPGRFDKLKAKKRTHNLSSKMVHAHHPHERKGDPKSRQNHKTEPCCGNVHITLMHAKKLRGKSSDPKRLRVVRTLKLRTKILKDSKKYNRKNHNRTMKHVEPKKQWIKRLVKATYKKKA